jgi:carbon monoxide dehydrogenase subunit G
MKVNLEKTFPMPVAANVAWRLLQDIEAVAACMPGAKITERVDDTHYKGTVTSRVGPATLSFNGTIEVLEVDPANMTLRMVGKGTARSGSSGASMDLTARIETADDDKSNLIGNSEVSMTEIGGEAPAQSGTGQQAETPAPPETSLNALALLWGVIKDAVRRLFGKKNH